MGDKCYGYLRTNTGDQIPVYADLTQGTEASVSTDAALTGTAQNIGNYKPGATVVSGELMFPTAGCYCYILRQGIVLSWFLPNKSGVSNREQKLSKPVILRPGDTLRALAVSATSRVSTLLVNTNQGVSRIFTGTAATGSVELTDLQDGTSIGDVLQGQTVTMAAFVTNGNNSKVIESSGGCWIRNASGQLAGAIPTTNMTLAEPMISSVNIPIELNWTASIVSTA